MQNILVEIKKKYDMNSNCSGKVSLQKLLKNILSPRPSMVLYMSVLFRLERLFILPTGFLFDGLPFEPRGGVSGRQPTHLQVLLATTNPGSGAFRSSKEA